MAVSVQNDGAHPGEYRRETGTGLVTGVDRSKGRNVYVTINAEHLAEEVKAWADTHATGLDHAVTHAHQQGQRVAYVIDVHRTRGVDPAIPFVDLGKRQKVRDLVELYAVDGNGDPLPAVGDTPEATADRQRRHKGYREQEAEVRARAAQRDPVAEAADELERLTGQQAPPADPPPSSPPTAGSGPLAPCPKCGAPRGTIPLRRGPNGLEHLECPPAELADTAADVAAEQHAAALEEEATEPTAHERRLEQLAAYEPPPAPEAPTGPEEAPSAPQAAPDAQQTLPPPAARPPRRGRHEEARPWDYYNSDGSLNPGSYAMTAAVGMVELAARLIMEHNRVTSAATGRPVEAPTRGQVLSLARRLIGAADEVQQAIRADGYSDRMDMSHTRARGAIRSALDLYPVPFGAERDERDRWHANLVAYGTLLLEVSATLLEVGQ